MAKPIVLIHGAWHARWCWKYVVPQLIDNGCFIQDIDLPGHGDNKMLSLKDISLQSYVDYVCNILATYNEPAVLVGHSFAGVIISQIAENLPYAIDQLIYVAGYIPDSGKSLNDEVKKASFPGITTELIMNPKANEVSLSRSANVKELLYNHCNDVDSAFGLDHLEIEPYRPLLQPVLLTDAVFGKVKKTYIACLHDKTLVFADQKRMYRKLQCQSISLEADHSPFFSNPCALANVILNCAHDSLIV